MHGFACVGCVCGALPLLRSTRSESIVWLWRMHSAAWVGLRDSKLSSRSADAIMGVSFFSSLSTSDFSTFSRAFVTLYQSIAGGPPMVEKNQTYITDFMIS